MCIILSNFDNAFFEHMRDNLLWLYKVFLNIEFYDFLLPVYLVKN